MILEVTGMGREGNVYRTGPENNAQKLSRAGEIVMRNTDAQHVQEIETGVVQTYSLLKLLKIYFCVSNRVTKV